MFKARDFPGRGGIFHELNRLGVLFNAWTNWRTTNYFIFNIDSNKYLDAFKIHKNQVLYNEPLVDSVSIERGAVLGEERYRNGTNYIEFVDLMKNHAPDYRYTQRFTIGKVDEILNFTVSSVVNFRKKW